MEKNKPLLYLVSHRINLGDFENLPNNFIDNSMEALMSIVQFAPDLENLKGIEIDVKITKDNVLVVTHEGNIKSITKTKEDKFIRDLTYQELHNQEVTDIMYYYHGLMARSYLFPDGKSIRRVLESKLSKTTIIPRADDMFDYLSAVGYTGEILVELKGDNDKLETDEIKNKRRDALIELVNAYKGRLNIAIQGYDLNRVIQIGEETDVKIGALDNRLPIIGATKYAPNIKPSDISNMPFDFYALIWPEISEEMLTAIIREEKDLYAWTIDSSRHLLAVLNNLERFKQKYGVVPANTHLITNIPLMLNSFISGQNSNSRILNRIQEKYDFIYGDEQNLSRKL